MLINPHEQFINVFFSKVLDDVQDAHKYVLKLVLISRTCYISVQMELSSIFHKLHPLSKFIVTHDEAGITTTWTKLWKLIIIGREKWSFKIDIIPRD